MLTVATLKGGHSMLKAAGVVVAILSWSILCWGQSEEIERLNRLVQQQEQELEQLKAQLARIEQALGMDRSPALQPTSYQPRPPQVATAAPVQAAPAPAAQPTAAGFRFSADLRFRLDAA